MDLHNERKLITAEEVAERLGGISIKTVYDWIYHSKTNGFPVRRAGRKPVFKWDEILEWTSRKKH